MDLIFNILIGLVIAFLIGFLITRYFDQEYARELKSRSLADLEKMVYRYETEYFGFVGESNASVLEFREAIENKDIAALMKNWTTFRSNFQELERKAGHDGRPLIMDYYYTYELELKELYKRTKK
jgi:hypothetical protein